MNARESINPFNLSFNSTTANSARLDDMVKKTIVLKDFTFQNPFRLHKLGAVHHFSYGTFPYYHTDGESDDLERGYSTVSDIS